MSKAIAVTKSTTPSYQEMLIALNSIKGGAVKSESASFIEGVGKAAGVAAIAPKQFMFGAATTYAERSDELDKRKVEFEFNRAKNLGLL